MEHENEEEYEVTFAGVVVIAAFCAATFAVGMGLGHLSIKAADRIEYRRLAKKYATKKEVTEVNPPE